ncbi:hypothetical protein L228DRAFT_122819 [Xylona heveae TC161]|uniref:Uncharacterized protein n=1 Tax=Xylona heveae (strain CBS 132557 / TC161) TaxID=1328760 RepID=A0A165HM49_XYLHT|nr:hypothetical protein L228DRAFT_122819 [Xylona heveae TC161]KZF23720.1 hypothetical protein L228DRAFT_122819 [Xylona heveae TC161]
MDILQIIKTTLAALKNADIPACLVGEIALNYYNVPRVVHDIEICIPENSLSPAVSVLCSKNMFKLEIKEDYDLFTEYKRGFPRLLATSVTTLSYAVILFSDTYFGLNPLDRNIVCQDETRSFTTYSRQILDLVSKDDIKYIPVPRLPPFFIGLCRRFLESNDGMARIAAEQLLDGMDLDEEWVKANIISAQPQVLELAMTLICEKSSCNDEFLDHDVTCFVADKEEAERLRRIPGSGFQIIASR